SPLLNEQANDVVPPSTTAQISCGLSSHVQDAGYHDTPPPQTSLQIPVDRTAEAADNTPKVEQYPCARFKVSSRHLALSSPVFQHMIEGGLTNNRQQQPPSLTEVPLYNDDPEALLILLQAIHSQFRQVPRKVDLKTLTQIAILVDKYDFLEVTEFLVDHWLHGVGNTIQSKINNDLLSWICIAAVFERQSTLQKLCGVAILESSGTLGDGNLPIQSQVSSTNSQ
ncbi:MAG: hypothetical protein L6R38_009552, partial [Xanthoria sp. 2 TBL-2021]